MILDHRTISRVVALSANCLGKTLCLRKRTLPFPSLMPEQPLGACATEIRIRHASAVFDHILQASSIWFWLNAKRTF